MKAKILFLFTMVLLAANTSFSGELPMAGNKKIPTISIGEGNEGPTDFYGEDSPDAAKIANKPSQGTLKASSDSKNMEEGIAQAITEDDFGNQQLFPEITMKASVSSSDVNRVVCKGEVRDVVYSKEKGLKAQISGSNLFLKFYAKKNSKGETLYATSPVEMFIVCGDNTYNVILAPKRIPSQTIRLESGSSERIQKNTSIFAGQPFEKKIQTLIKHAYTDDFPESFIVENKNKNVPVYASVKTVLKRVIRIEGEGVSLLEFVSTPSVDMEVNEKTFMKKEFSQRPVAIALDRLRVKKNEPFRTFIIERSGESL